MPLSPDDLREAQIIWDYMFRCQEPSKSDVIIGLGCSDIGVADDAAVLFKRHIAPLIVFSGNVGRVSIGTHNRSEASLMKERAVDLGVPESAILLEEESTNTGENLRFVQRLLQAKSVATDSVVIVHKPYMLRRDYATFMQQWEGAATTSVAYWARETSMQKYLADNSLDPRETVCIMVGDLQRIGEYPRLGYQIEQEVPASVWKAYEVLVARGYDTQLLKNAA